MTITLAILSLAVQLLSAGMVVYLLLLTTAAFLAPRQVPLNNGPFHTFLILIPAHNEEKLLPHLLRNLGQLEYPREHFAIHIVADNCADRTAALGRQLGAQVHERFNEQLRGKGYALQWLLGQLEEQRVPGDAFVILDADSLVSPNFLNVMNAHINRGDRAIQAYYSVQAPEESSSVALRYAALAVLHFLRPQGRTHLGWSVGLKGNGMVFVAELLQRHQWSASLTEDIEFHMQLVLAGERVTFAPDAVVRAEMPNALDAASRAQNVRWERGRLQMVRQYVPRLLRGAVAQRSLLLADAAIEQLIPPFAVLTGVTLAAMLLTVALPTGLRLAGVIIGLLSLVGQAVYLLAGLRLAGAPRAVYLSLLDVPRYLFWKIGLYLRVLFGAHDRGWTRTTRN